MHTEKAITPVQSKGTDCHCAFLTWHVDLLSSNAIYNVTAGHLEAQLAPFLQNKIKVEAICYGLVQEMHHNSLVPVEKLGSRKPSNFNALRRGNSKYVTKK